MYTLKRIIFAVLLLGFGPASMTAQDALPVISPDLISPYVSGFRGDVQSGGNMDDYTSNYVTLGKTLKASIPSLAAENDFLFLVYQAGTLHLLFGPYPLDSKQVDTDESALLTLGKQVKNSLPATARNRTVEVSLVQWSASAIIRKGDLSSGREKARKTQAVLGRLAVLQSKVDGAPPLGNKFTDSDVEQANKAVTAGQELQDALMDGVLSKEQQATVKGIRDAVFGKGEPGGTKGKSGKPGGRASRSGCLPFEAPFAKWFSLVVESLAEYFQVKELITKALILAYLVAPELMDEIANSLAHLQNTIVPNELSNVLDNAADKLEVLYDLYSKLRQLERMIANPDFQMLLADLDGNLDLAAKELGQYALKNISKVLPPEVRNYLDCVDFGKSVSPSNEFSNCVAEQTRKLAVNQLGKILPPEIAAIVTPFTEEDPNAVAAALLQAADLACDQVPKEFRGSCQSLARGDIEDAAITAAENGIAKVTGIPFDDIRGAYQSLKERDPLEAARSIANAMNEKTLADVLGTASKAWNDAILLRDKKDISPEDAMNIIVAILDRANPELKAQEIYRAGKDVVKEYEHRRYVQSRVAILNDLRANPFDAISYDLQKGNFLSEQLEALEQYLNFQDLTARQLAKQGHLAAALAQEATGGGHQSPKTYVKNSINANLKGSKDYASLFKRVKGALKKYKSPASSSAPSLKITTQSTPWLTWFQRVQKLFPAQQDGHIGLYVHPSVSSNVNINSPARRIYYVNGIMTPKLTHIETAREISRVMRHPVYGVYSYSKVVQNGNFVSAFIDDLYRSNKLNGGTGHTTEHAAQVLAAGIILDLTSDPNRKVTLIAHSRGAAMAYWTVNRAAVALQAEGKIAALRNLEVITLGGLAPRQAEKWHYGLGGFHPYKNKLDPIPDLWGLNPVEALAQLKSWYKDQLTGGNIPAPDPHFMTAYYDYLKNHR